MSSTVPTLLSTQHTAEGRGGMLDAGKALARTERQCQRPYSGGVRCPEICVTGLKPSFSTDFTVKGSAWQSLMHVHALPQLLLTMIQHMQSHLIDEETKAQRARPHTGHHCMFSQLLFPQLWFFDGRLSPSLSCGLDPRGHEPSVFAHHQVLNVQNTVCTEGPWEMCAENE